MEIGIPLPAGKVRAPNIGVSNPLRKRSAVARRGARFVFVHIQWEATPLSG